MSPDGRRAVVTRTVHGNTDLWLLEGAGTSRFTFDAVPDWWPVWSPDGTSIVFRSNRTGRSFDLYQKPSSGAGVEELIVASDQHKAAVSWSADGRFLLYPSYDPQMNNDLWVVPMLGDRTPAVFLRPRSTRCTPSFLRTAAGWPTIPTRRVACRFTFGPLSRRVQRVLPVCNGRCRPRAA